MKQLGSLIDKYVFLARVAPVALVAFSLFLSISAWIPFSEWPIKLLGGSTFLAIGAFALAQVTRDAGKRIEGPLWESWGGPPTVRMLRHRDTTIATGSKARLHRHLVELGIVDHLPSEEEEQENPKRADEVYRTCSDWLRRKALELKAKSPFDVVHSENISYGFRRNILGIKAYGLAILAAAMVVTLIAFFFGKLPIIELCALLIVGAYLIFGVTESALKRAANDYSMRLLDAAQALQAPAKAASRRKPAGNAKQK